MDILNKIRKYTEPTPETYMDTLQKVNSEIVSLEKQSRGIHDNSKRNSVLRAITMMQQQMIDIIDILEEQ